MNNNKSFSFYAGVFLISGMVMALQIMQSRIFSVVAWYHLSFVVISIAMFGLTLGALKIYRGDEQYYRDNFTLVARRHSIAFAFFIVIGLLAQIYIPIVSEKISRTLMNLPVVAVMISAAYYHAGIVITTCLTRSPYPIGKVYGVDLLGAGLGCLFVLGVMEVVDTPTGVLFLTSLSFLVALCFAAPNIEGDSFRLGTSTFRLRNLSLAFSLLFFCIACANILLPQPFLYTVFFKSATVTRSMMNYEKWNPISRVIISKERENQRPFLWGRSPLLPTEYKATYQELYIDGDASTPITKFDGDFSKHKYLEFDVTNIAYSLPGLKKAAIIGVGGGRDLLSAKYFGLEKVWAMDVNPIQIHLLTQHPSYRDYSNLYKLPGVSIFTHEARSWFRQNTEKLDVIQMSLIDTWASTGAGAFALSENGLYTVEAWQVFINDLSDHGVFTVSRWAKDTESEFTRTVSVAMNALFNLGVKDVRKHMAIIHSHLISTLLVSKSPFTLEQIEALKKTALDKGFELSMLPDQPLPGGTLGAVAQAQSADELYKIAEKQVLDVSPSTDMRPFFFSQARLSKPIDIIKKVIYSKPEQDLIMNGQAKALLNLYIIVVFSFVMALLVIVIPLLKTLDDKRSSFFKGSTLYFFLIGLGFMLIEISFLQALGVFLGHPIYGLSIVLFSLILSAGIGSLISDKIPLSNFTSQFIWAVLTSGYCICVAFLLPSIFNHYAESELLERILVSVAMIFPAGMLMGFGFPTGLMIAERFDRRSTAWLWGINGAAGIFGSTIGIALNIAIGIDKTLMIGSLCYLMLIFCFVIFKQAKSSYGS
ncbi:MAG: hypothetical protein IPH06_09700 [Alphaproteobacteria bacterium]|jgi:spermidine synthase|nr:hypothetical protein [Alphaproteobacteria bacterium]QQS58266.1 MAG: hypothetical protein IPN28_05455 [Alphaproteobacteria bacterium]